MLLTKQRNSLFEVMLQHNLQPTNFLEDNQVKAYAILGKKPYYFRCAPTDDERNKVDSIPVVAQDQSSRLYGMSWYNVLKYFEKWASLMQDEIETPDLWEEARANAQLFASNAKTPDEMFSDTELRQLQGQIRQIEQGITALGLPAHAQQALLEAVKEAPEKATRFTKKEWQGWFIGAVVAQVTNLALSPEHVAAVAQLLKSTFTGLLQLH